jgi:hypothetical protein
LTAEKAWVYSIATLRAAFAARSRLSEFDRQRDMLSWPTGLSVTIMPDMVERIKATGFGVEVAQVAK